jgi:hypothetical protein
MSPAQTKKSQPAVDEAPATVPQTTPTAIGGYGHPEYQFVQAIMEMQKSLGEINASIASLTKSVESTKTKVDDLVKWKNMILGGVLVGGALISGFAYLITKASDYITVKTPSAQIIQMPYAPSPQIAPLKIK